MHITQWAGNIYPIASEYDATTKMAPIELPIAFTNSYIVGFASKRYPELGTTVCGIVELTGYNNTDSTYLTHVRVRENSIAINSSTISSMHDYMIQIIVIGK